MPLLERLLKISYLILLIVAFSTNYVDCIRYKEKIKESGLGNLLLGLAGSAVSQGIQSATGSPMVSNPAMNNYGNVASMSTPAAAVTTALGVPNTVATSGANINNSNNAAIGGSTVGGAGVAPNTAAAASMGGTSAPGAMGTAATAPNIAAGIQGSTPSALSFTTIAFGSIVIMMICMVMLMCRRCSKDDD